MTERDAMRSTFARTMLVFLCATLCTGIDPAASAERSQSPVVHHDLVVSLDPANHGLKVRDRFRIPGALVTAPFTISLNADLNMQAVSGGLKLLDATSRLQGSDPAADRDNHDPAPRVPVNVYRVEGAMPGQELTGELDYEGVIDYTVQQSGSEYARAFSESPGLIESRGVFLAGSTRWVPRVGNTLVTYTLAVELPAGWKSVSQGERTSGDTPPSPLSGGSAPERWSVATPTEEVHLIAAPFTEYSRDAGAVKAFAFLRKPDQVLADRYLDATAQYLEMYSGLLGPYPYSKFALVENFWETGYGMPSFTLLGEQVIRFPFILHSSYPHELLHNWWGNGVFVDLAGGNWCEGLTAYLADHLIAEQRGQGADHRRAILQRVTDYVTPENDFPVSRFVSRHDAVTEAIGYGKTAMMWNMLREKVGDAQFIRALQAFYRDNRFRAASFDDIEKSFEVVSGFGLRAFFEQWTKAVGTPELRLEHAAGRDERVDITLSQVQHGRLFALDVPVVIATDKGVETRTISMPSDKARIDVSLDLKGPAQRVEIDPQFQVYRRLSPFEIPPSLSKAFGAKKVLIVMSAQSAPVYAGLVKAWSRDGVETVMDSQLDALPADRAVWVLGAGNKFAPVVAEALKAYGASLDASGLRTPNLPSAGDRVGAAARSVVAAVRHPKNPDSVVIYVAASSEAAAEALARKLPHYGKYSWLVFAGDEATNEATGEWPVGDTPLARNLTPQAKPIKLAPRKALAEVRPQFDTARMKADVEWLAAPEREGRGAGSSGLDAAANYIAERFARLGLSPLTPGARVDDRYFQPFGMTGESGAPLTARNVIGVLLGANPALNGHALIVSAHYDHLGFGWPDARAGAKGQLHPGADDNASGVAVMLELARLMADARPERSIIFAAFAGEEAGLAGSRHYVRAAQTPGAAFPLSDHIADLNLDTVGHLGDGKVTIFGAGSARELPFIFMGATAVTGVPTQAVAQEINASDHTAFVEVGVPSVQLFASVASDYHRPSDTADRIDYVGMAKVAAILKEAVDYLAARAEPLNFSGSASAARSRPAAPTVPRRAATGIVPDMTDQGEGVRVGSVQPGSGAEHAGLKPGDRLLALGGVKTSNLRALADALRDLAPGQTVDVEFARDAAVMSSTLVLGER
ncbi:MAG TPA: M20/M25/M40 family metallo-hydrolase [Xanthobacteraceae bacterium]|nr:M20/M25/M40 family metallo-hydrolase [Xanthobacteraceae bacterium]